MLERQVTIVNRLGMHARASAKFVMAASKFKSEIWINKIDGGERVEGKSIMGLMMLAAAKGDDVLITAKGEDAEEALDLLSALIGKKFGEEGKG